MLPCVWFYRFGSYSRCPVSVIWFPCKVLIRSHISLLVSVDIVIITCFILPEFTPGEIPWKKPSSSVPWACSATWRTQRQWNQLIQLKWNQRVRVTVFSTQASVTMILSAVLSLNSVNMIVFLKRWRHGVSSLPFPRWLVIQVLCRSLLCSQGEYWHIAAKRNKTVIWSSGLFCVETVCSPCLHMGVPQYQDTVSNGLEPFYTQLVRDRLHVLYSTGNLSYGFPDLCLLCDGIDSRHV